MSSVPEQALLPSLLDRLLDPDSAGTVWRSGYGLKETIESVQRDLEDLLNTRRARTSVPESFPELARSVYTYGIPDFSSLEVGTPAARQRLSAVVEQVIELHEPRLKQVRALLLDPLDEKDTNLRFQIDARLRVDPSPEVSFETVLELMTGHAKVARRGES